MQDKGSYCKLQTEETPSNNAKSMGYWVSHWKRIENEDVVACTLEHEEFIEYRLGSPSPPLGPPWLMHGFRPEYDNGNFLGYSVHLSGPHMSVTFYRKDVKYAKKIPPKIKPSNFILFPVDKVNLLGKDQIRGHVKQMAEEDKFNVDTKTALGAIDEAFKELESFLEQLK